jgi:hypothetical protein
MASRIGITISSCGFRERHHFQGLVRALAIFIVAGEHVIATPLPVPANILSSVAGSFVRSGGVSQCGLDVALAAAAAGCRLCSGELRGPAAGQRQGDSPPRPTSRPGQPRPHFKAALRALDRTPRALFASQPPSKGCPATCCARLLRAVPGERAVWGRRRVASTRRRPSSTGVPR